MEKELEKIVQNAHAALNAATGMTDVEAVRIGVLGRKGTLTALLRGIAELPAEERPAAGERGNAARGQIEAAIAERLKGLQGVTEAELADREWIDVTAPGARPPQGHLHPVSAAIREIGAIFGSLGFQRVRYPEVEWDYYAFESLNMPPDHPARDEWETFFIAESGKDKAERIAEHPKYGKMVLTPHTSSGQVREMERVKPPIRMMNISKCYRRQSDVSHVPMFHQFEGLLIDEVVSVTHLRGVLQYFAHEFFGPERKTRLRPFHFRFTEPSFEVDISCGVCGGSGRLPTGGKCRLCKDGWLELGGAGMVHPNVLRAGGIDSRRYSGFAFGWGVERTWMMKTGVNIDDVRLLYKNDIRFLRQF
ncbi:MAG: phenylalanine--tRNA ligase subunit alpha [Patescibacteria group bacterium]